MYRLFRRFERLGFGIVTTSAVTCAVVLVAHRYGIAAGDDPAAPQVGDVSTTFALYCQEVSEVDSCEQLLADWKKTQ